MKMIPLFLLTIAISAHGQLTQSPPGNLDQAKMEGTEAGAKPDGGPAGSSTHGKDLKPEAMPKPWSVVGTYTGTSPEWNDTVEIRADGSFTRKDGYGGAWSLAGKQDRITLLLQWDGFPAQTVSMVSADEFRGKTHQGELTLKRQANEGCGSGTGSAGGEGKRKMEIVIWHQGEPAVKIMKQQEGFCVLTLVKGHPAGWGKVVRTYVGDDGYWYLGGQSGQKGVAGQCLVIRYKDLRRG